MNKEHFASTFSFHYIIIKKNTVFNFQFFDQIYRQKTRG